MIGVKARPGQEWAVEEFFELFKTPWEFFRSDQVYDVVIATSNDVPKIDKGLLLIYQAEHLEWDERHSLVGSERRNAGSVKHGNVTLPIYAGLLSFDVVPNLAIWADAGEGGAIVVSLSQAPLKVVRLGYNLFDEVEFLLTQGQPIENAGIPTLDLHVSMLRDCILDAGIPIAEIPPVPAGHSFAVCLTHDIDFIGIRQHFLDHSMFGFVYRATIGSIQRFIQKRLTVPQVMRNWAAVASLPLVYAGLLRDFWEPFEWYLSVENGLDVTYFLIPVKHHPGDGLSGSRANLRASAYDVTDIPETAKRLLQHGCEVGVHGIDAWNSVEKGRMEAQRVADSADQMPKGIRMHWLMWDQDSPSKLESAGFNYDSTVGYNETIGYRAGTSQAFCPKGSKELLELPMHIQDGALFYPQRLNLSEKEAAEACSRIFDHAKQNGGVATLIWHDRSHGPERFWGSFYVSLIETLKSSDVWFGTCADVAEWFRVRRSVKFKSEKVEGGRRVRMVSALGANNPGMRIRIYNKHSSSDDTQPAYSESCWDGRSAQEALL
ncbi:MAG TPA: hypothetical protein VGI45_29635 [Terracidiphilus sp.]